ncbi:hypothetical protein AM4_146 [Lactococcus phage AM4]|uniref:Uncharacterized protein n=1 Tax=Lactococcus phage AM4 TaxID=1965472 RepID=A0A1W6JKQ1_9CAUD|nr:hypothetical protein H1Z35_gp106 [Lactococcus phage AM4]ARM66804.1 hypothetical protein AM4_146 [Lactococcus phage AM4]
MPEINYYTVLRLAENLKKITREEFELLEKINDLDAWNDFDDLERLVNDYIIGDFKIIEMPLNTYINTVVRKEIDGWLDENEKIEIVEAVLEKLYDFNEINSFTDYQTGKEYTLLYDNFDIATIF